MTRPLTIIALISILAAGCGTEDEACVRYTVAAEACFTAAADAGLDVDVDFSDVDGFCESFAATDDATWQCSTDAYTGADCSTQEGFDAAFADADACPPLS